MWTRCSLCALVAISILQHTLSDAFPVSTATRGTSITSLYQNPRSSVTALYAHLFDDHGDFFDVEAARRQLESLVTGGGGMAEPVSREDAVRSLGRVVSREAESISPLPAFPPILDMSLPPRPPLTTTERERRETEIEMLKQLDHGDASLSDIWNLWFSERGPQAASLLHKADDLMDEGQAGWEESELILRSLIEDYGIYFSEPVYRLATLYYLQGRFQESLQLNKVVLAVKPWHFGALSHIVMVYAALGDNVSARRWAIFRLPGYAPVGLNRRRSRWVEKVVVDAMTLLHQGEKGLSDVFGESDESWMENQKKKFQNYYNDGDDAWQ